MYGSGKRIANPKKMNIQINPQEIHGNWRAGYALDFHTISSRLLPNGTYNTGRTEIGELVYQVKYRQDRSQIQSIAEITAKFVKEEFTANGYLVFPYLDAVIPIPPSDKDRPFQPVPEIAAKIGHILDIPVILDYLIKAKETIPLKNLEGEENRREQLHGAFAVQATPKKYRCVLLFDDIYRSGETLTEVTDVFHKQGNIFRVLVLTLTRTRTKR